MAALSQDCHWKLEHACVIVCVAQHSLQSVVVMHAISWLAQIDPYAMSHQRQDCAQFAAGGECVCEPTKRGALGSLLIVLCQHNARHMTSATPPSALCCARAATAAALPVLRADPAASALPPRESMTKTSATAMWLAPSTTLTSPRS